MGFHGKQSGGISELRAQSPAPAEPAVSPAAVLPVNVAEIQALH